jgi:hypothetical protein
MKKTVLVLAALLLCGSAAMAQLFYLPPPYRAITAATLGTCATGRENAVYMVLNAASSNVCTGTGTAASLCVCDGAAWRAIGGSNTNIQDASGDTTTWVAISGASTGSLAALSDAELTYNATTNALTTTTFVGALTGAASQAVVADASGDTSAYPLLAGDLTGSKPVLTDAGLSYNATTEVLTVATVAAALVGNADTATGVAISSTAPTVCDVSTSLGALYVDTTGPDLCYCPGAAGWLPVDGTGTCA